MASESIFSSHFSFFYRPVALLCGSKKASRYENLAFIASSDILNQLQFFKIKSIGIAMKKLYLLLPALLCTLVLFAQEYNPNNTHSLSKSCINPGEGTITIALDLSQNCPEADPNGVLPGTSEFGFHSGLNHWAVIQAWDDPNSVTLMNDGNDMFEVTLNTMDYWGTALEDIENIRMVANNGIAEPTAPWDLFVKDSVDALAFGNLDNCSDLILHMDQTPTCADLNQESSLALFSDAGDSESCVDHDNGLIRIDIDYGISCPEGDPNMDLAGQAELALHSGINGWATSVAFDDPNALTVTNDGNDNFSVIINPETYYNTPLSEVEEIFVIPNNAIANPDDPWGVFIKDPRDGGFGGSEDCSDLVMIISEAPACDLSTSTLDFALQHSFKAAPNPFGDRTYLEFSNPNNSTFQLVISNLGGQVMRTMSGVTGERVLVERNDLPAGMYFANLIDDNGHFATTKLVVK